MEQMITSLGFPIACCLGLAYYVKYQNELMIKDNKEDKEMWTKELQYSREVNAKLSTVFKNRGVKKRTDLYWLNSTSSISCLIEVCFVDSKADNIANIGKYLLNDNITINGSAIINPLGNILSGKKWVACGDSFTAGGYSSSDGIDETIYKYQEGLYKGKQITYPYIIGLRNNMTIANEAISGSCMGKPTTSSRTDYFSNTRYKNIPSDADYITLYFGINDDNYDTVIGTIDDTDNTTFYGAWNIVMEYLITNHPYTKIGIIITNGSNPQYTEATRNIAKKWGIPFLDLELDYNVPLMIRATERPELCDKVVQLRRDSFKISSTNTHPNVKAHEYQSTFIENWLRSL